MKANFSISEDIIDGLLKKDCTALEALYKGYGSDLYGLISNVIANQEARIRVLQKVLYDVWQNINRFDPEKEKFFAWMMKIVRRNIATECQTPSLLNIGKNEEVVKNALLNAINASDYPIFYKIFFFGTSIDEVGKDLNMSTAEVRKSLYKAMENLRAHLSQYLEP